ncbi:MAG: radical SAM protein [bacterium]
MDILNPKNRADIVLVAEIDDLPVEPPGAGEVIGQYFREPLKLIRPFPGARPPHPHMLGPVRLAAWLKRGGFAAEVFDNIFSIPSSREGFLSALERGPRAVGISTTFMISPPCISRIARHVRERCPQALLILGGRTAERSAEVRAMGDVTVLGPGEKTLSGILSCLREGTDWRGLPNLIYLRDGREVCAPRESNFVLEESLLPDWSALPVRPTQCFMVQASTGCHYRCAFCSHKNLGQSRLWISGTVSQIRDVHERFGATLFRFADSTLTSRPEDAEALCRALACEKLPVEWICNARVDNLAARPSLAAAMHSAGCRWVICGVESGSEKILRAMNKGFSRREILDGVRFAREAGLLVHCNFLIGFPGETRQSVDETLEVVDICRPDKVAFLILNLREDRNSDITRRPEHYGLTGALTDWSHATMDSEEARDQVRRCIEEVATRMERPVLGTEGIQTFMLRGSGLSEEESLAYLEGIRDYHRARLHGCDAGIRTAIAAIRSGCGRLNRAWEAEGWRECSA